MAAMAAETLAAAMASPIAAYRCASKKGHRLRRLHQHDAGRRDSAATAPRRPPSRWNARSTNLARLLDIDPFEMRRKNVVRPGDNIESIWKEPSDASFGSYGIGGMSRYRRAGAARRATASHKPDGADWAEGQGASHWPCWNAGRRPSIARAPEMRLQPDGTYHLACGSTEMGNGITTAHKQIAASILGTRADDIDIINADTDRTPYDTGTFAEHRRRGRRQGGSPGAPRPYPPTSLTSPVTTPAWPIDQCRLDSTTSSSCGNHRISAERVACRRHEG